MIGLDTAIFRFINSSLANPVLDFLMASATRLAGREFLAALAVVLLILAKNYKKLSGIIILAGLTLTYYAIFYLKNFIARPRPFVALTGVHLVEHAEGFSFPSNHAANAFLVAMILSGFYKGRSLFFILAFSVALSRVYLGVHFPSDVLAGAGLGLAFGQILLRIARRSCDSKRG